MCELVCAGQMPELDERLASMKRLIAQLFQLVRDVATALRKPGQSFGLVGMQERMLMLGGQLLIDSQPGEGTTLCARINLEEEIAA